MCGGLPWAGASQCSQRVESRKARPGLPNECHLHGFIRTAEPPSASKVCVFVCVCDDPCNAASMRNCLFIEYMLIIKMCILCARSNKTAWRMCTCLHTCMGGVYCASHVMPCVSLPARHFIQSRKRGPSVSVWMGAYINFRYTLNVAAILRRCPLTDETSVLFIGAYLCEIAVNISLLLCCDLDSSLCS